jgi:tetratricopeptide (TPR) repeat protein
MIASRFSMAFCEMGRCYEKLGRYPEALIKFDRVLQINMSYAEAKINRQRILDKMGRPQ